MPVYIIQAETGGPVKIGGADKPRKRLASIQAAHHQRLKIVRLFDAPRGLEDIIHRHYAHLWIRGEWFTFSPCMLTHGFAPELPIPELKQVRSFERARRQRLGVEAARIRDVLSQRASWDEGMRRLAEATK